MILERPKRTLFSVSCRFPHYAKRKKLYAKRRRTAELGRDFPDMTRLSARNVKRRIFRKTMPPPDNPDQIVGPSPELLREDDTDLK